MNKRIPSLWQMGVGKPAIHLLVVACLLLAACSGSQLTKAYNTVNAISAVRNGLPPIYDAVTNARPELTDEIQAFDAELQKGILSTYDTLIAIKQGEGTYDDYRTKIAAIISVLDRYKVEEKVPELKPGIDLIKQLLGVA